MAGLSTYAETALFGWLRGTAMPSAPAATWLALWNGDPGDAAAGGTDVTATIRPGGRVAAAFGAPAGGAMSNAATIDFGTAAAAAGVSHFALFDAGVGGNLLLSGALAGGAKAVAAGDAVSVPVASLAVALS